MRRERRAEGAVGRALLGPHRRWGGAVSAVNSQPEGREFPQAGFTSAEDMKGTGSPGGASRPGRTITPWTRSGISPQRWRGAQRAQARCAREAWSGGRSRSCSFGAPSQMGRRGKRRKFAARRARISAGGIHFRRGYERNGVPGRREPAGAHDHAMDEIRYFAATVAGRTAGTKKGAHLQPGAAAANGKGRAAEQMKRGIYATGNAAQPARTRAGSVERKI